LERHGSTCRSLGHAWSARERADVPPREAGGANRYARILEHIFHRHFRVGATVVRFPREDIVAAAQALDVDLPKNLGDVIYSFRYRVQIPATIREKAPPGKEWVIRPAGRAQYAFAAIGSTAANIIPTQRLADTKMPDATPGVIIMYALNDEQALLAILRYNRLVDVFTGVTCYSLQSHLRTTVPSMGQVETDEVYIGIDRRGAHYVFPVQAKGGKDSINVVQIEQDIGLCESKFPNAICRPIAAQFMEDDLIALFEFEVASGEVKVAAERHYRLVVAGDINEDDLRAYRTRTL
jgi:hypothetical protein